MMSCFRLAVATVGLAASMMMIPGTEAFAPFAAQQQQYQQYHPQLTAVPPSQQYLDGLDGSPPLFVTDDNSVFQESNDSEYFQMNNNQRGMHAVPHHPIQHQHDMQQHDMQHQDPSLQPEPEQEALFDEPIVLDPNGLEFAVGKVVRVCRPDAIPAFHAPKASHNQFYHTPDEKARSCFLLPAGLAGRVVRVYNEDVVSANFPILVQFQNKEGASPATFQMHFAPDEVEIVE